MEEAGERLDCSCCGLVALVRWVTGEVLVGGGVVLTILCVAFCIFGSGAGTKAGVGSSRSGSVLSVYLEVSIAVSGSLGMWKSDCFLFLPDPDSEPEPLLLLEISNFGASFEVPGEREPFEVFC